MSQSKTELRPQKRAIIEKNEDGSYSVWLGIACGCILQTKIYQEAVRVADWIDTFVDLEIKKAHPEPKREMTPAEKWEADGFPCGLTAPREETKPRGLDEEAVEEVLVDLAMDSDPDEQRIDIYTIHGRKKIAQAIIRELSPKVKVIRWPEKKYHCTTNLQGWPIDGTKFEDKDDQIWNAAIDACLAAYEEATEINREKLAKAIFNTQASLAKFDEIDSKSRQEYLDQADEILAELRKD